MLPRCRWLSVTRRMVVRSHRRWRMDPGHSPYVHLSVESDPKQHPRGYVSSLRGAVRLGAPRRSDRLQRGDRSPFGSPLPKAGHQLVVMTGEDYCCFLLEPVVVASEASGESCQAPVYRIDHHQGIAQSPALGKGRPPPASGRKERQ